MRFAIFDIIKGEWNIKAQINIPALKSKKKMNFIIGLLLVASVRSMPSLPYYSDLRVGNPLSMSYVWKRSSEGDREHDDICKIFTNDFLKKFLVYK